MNGNNGNGSATDKKDLPKLISEDILKIPKRKNNQFEPVDGLSLYPINIAYTDHDTYR